MKKNLTWLLLIATLLLVGCGKKTDDDTITVEFWHDNDDVVISQIENFNKTIGKENGIFVEGNVKSDELMSLVSQNDYENLPDIALLDVSDIAEVYSFDGLVQAETKIDKSSFIDSAISALSINDKLIATPYKATTPVLFYNEDYLTEASYDAPAQTIAELALMLTELTAKTDAKYGLSAEIDLFEIEAFINAQDKTVGNNNGGHSGNVATLQMAEDNSLLSFLTLWEKIVLSSAYKATDDMMTEEFASGTHAMAIMDSSKALEIDKLIGNSFEWSVSKLPTVTSRDTGDTYANVSGLFVFDNYDGLKVNACYQFISYLTSEDSQLELYTNGAYVPVNNKVFDTEEYKSYNEKFDVSEIANNLVLSSSSDRVMSFVPNYNLVNEVIKEQLLSFAKGEIGVTQTLENILYNCQEKIDDYYRENPIIK